MKLFRPIKVGLWANNSECPECLAPVDPGITCNEFGYAYCSYSHASAYVNREWRSD